MRTQRRNWKAEVVAAAVAASCCAGIMSTIGTPLQGIVLRGKPS